MKNRKPTLSQYSLLSAGMIALPGATDAQAVFTDLEPDVLVYSGVFENEPMKYFDFDDDGLDDVGILYSVDFVCGYCPYNLSFNVELLYGAEIAFMMAPSLSLWSTYQSSYSSSVGECQIPSHAVARGFFSGEVITPLADFTVMDELALTYSCGSNGDFGVQNDLDIWESPASPATKPFIAFRFMHDGETHLGWLRLYSGPEDENVYVTHMGYQKTAGASLEMSLATMEIAVEPQSHVSAFYQSGNFTIINQSEPIMLNDLTIYSVEGKMIYQTQHMMLDQAMTIPVDVMSGMYIIHMQTPEGLSINRKCQVLRN